MLSGGFSDAAGLPCIVNVNFRIMISELILWIVPFEIIPILVMFYIACLNVLDLFPGIALNQPDKQTSSHLNEVNRVGTLLKI